MPKWGAYFNWKLFAGGARQTGVVLGRQSCHRTADGGQGAVEKFATFHLMFPLLILLLI